MKLRKQLSRARFSNRGQQLIQVVVTALGGGGGGVVGLVLKKYI
jgi:hypothetical protein